MSYVKLQIGKYVQKNDHWSFWGERDRGDQDYNYVYHFTYLEDIIKHYNTLTPGLIRIIQVSDGCADQYKSKYVKNMLCGLCDKMGIEEILLEPNMMLMLSAIMIFKRELWGIVRCADGFEVFEEITGDDGMQQPFSSVDRTKTTVSIRC